MRFVERIVENVCYRFAIPDGISQADIDVKIQSTLQDKKLLQTISLTPTVLGNNITVTRLGTDTYVKQAMLSSSQAGGQVRSQIRLLLDQITYDFNRVLTWLIGRQLPASDAKLQEILFAMQLFKNEDADLLGRFFPERAPDALSSLTNDINSKLPFSAQLSNWCTFLRSSVAYWEESTYKQRVVECLPQLDKLYIFQKQVEHLKECSNNNSRASARNKLQHTLTKEVGSLKENQSTLLPGGVWQEEKGYITPMIYQVTRLGSENHGKGARYKVKVFDPAGLLSTTSREQELIEKEFSEGELYQFIKTSTIVLSGAKKTHLPSEKASITSVLTNMLTSKLKEYFFGKDEFEKLKLAQESKDATTSFTREKALQESFSIRSSSVSKETILRPQRLIKKPLMHLFLKELKKQDSAKESLASEKSLFQASLLLSIHKKYQHELSQVEFRTWVRQNALTLLSSLEKQKKTLEAAASPQRNQITAIVQGLEVILQKIDTLDKQLLLPLPDKSQSSNLSKAFQEPFCPTHKLFQSVKRSISQQAISKELLLHKEEASSAILTTQQLEKALLKVEKALGQGYFLEAHYSIKNLYLSLERNQNEPYVKELSPKTLLELQKLLLRTSWGEHKKAPSALDFRFILLSIKLQFEIAKPISPPDISFFEEIAKDHYFSQADSASKIQEYFRYFNTIPSDVKQSPFDIPFDNGKIENTVISELQQTLLLSAVFVAPERTLQLGQMSQIGKVGVRLSSTVQGSTIEELNSNASKLWHPLQLQVVLEELTSRRSNISFKFETSVIDGKPAVLLMPAGLRICDPQDDLMQKGIGGRFDQELPHLFKAQRLELPEDLSKHVFQQVVSENAHHAYGYDDQGKAIERKPIHFKNTPGNYSHFRFDGRTEQQILESDISILNLPTDSSKELQLIMSDPHRTRIEALISFLNKNISTFNDLKTGGALERLLETILLRDGALFHLEKGEKAVLGIYSSLAKLAAQSYRTGNYRAFCHIYKVFQLLPKRPDFSKEESLLSTYFNERIKQKAVPERRQILECYLLRTALEFDATGSLPENSADLLEKINEYRALPATRYEKDPQVEERIQELGLAIAPVEAKIELLPQKRGMVFAKLPPSIYLAPYFKTIQRLAADSISNIDLLGSTWMRREIISPFTAGEYTLKTTSHLFRIIADNEGNIRFLKRQRGGWLKAHRWYHYQPSLFEASQSKGQIAQKSTPTWQVPRINPHSSSQQDYWITLDGKDLLIEEKGVPIWRAMLDSRSSTILSMKNEKEKRVLFNTSTNAFFQRFRDIEHDAFVVSTGDEKSEQVTKVAYQRFDVPLDYTFDEVHNAWLPSQFNGYKLSEKSLNLFAQAPSAHPQQSIPLGSRANLENLFQPGFKNYHLLESIEGDHMPLILLPGATFKMLQDVASLMHLQNPNSPTTTHSLRVPTPNWKLEEGKTTALYAYKIDPLRGLIPKEIPNGALYLSYALAAQGNMKDAFRYFQMATIGRSIDRAGQDIVVELKSLLDHYPSVGSSLPYKAALQLRAKLFTLQLQKKEKISSQDLQELQQLESIATPLRMQFTHEEIAALNTLKKQATNDTVCAALRERICELKSHLPAPPKAENRSPSPQSASKGPTTSYANQIEQELQADLQSFKNRDSSKGVKRIHHGTMQQAEQKKAAILQRFTTGSQKEIDDIRRLQQLATASGTTAEELLFQKALRDFGEGKCWDPSLHQEIQEYLQLAICASQGGQATFHYNIRENSIAPTILLLEYQLGFTCRPSQIQVVEDVLSRDNCFKQEICGGGKTTVLRNILSHVKADGATLAGVSTLEPLRGEHGPQLARTTSSAFGQRVFDFHFDRTSPTTEESLLTLYKNLLETTINRGRIDLSKKDLHSFRSALILKQESLQEAQLLYKASEKPIYKEQIERLNREIDIMEDCREFLMTRVALISDELDKDTDCAEEFNYALGATAGIESTKQTVLITFFQELFSSKTPHCQALGKAIRQNEQKDLSTETIHAALEEIATRVAQHYMEELSRLNLGLNKEEITNYLLDKEPAASKTYKILLETKTQAKNELCFLHQYISSIAPTAFCKKGGVSFGRSVDGVRVIPFLGSDKPKEGSEHGKETERLFYTCLDYLDASRNGVDLQQIENYYLDTLKKAQAEVNELAKQNPLGLFSIDETKTAKAFRERFPDIQKPLSQVTPEDCVSLHKKINSDPHAVLEHLRRFILPELRQSPEKIVGNAQDIPSMVHSFSGFSGTDTAIHAMPDKIDTQNARQAGAHGEILTALYTSEKELKEAHIPSFLSIEANEPPYLLLASQISWGDALSDVGKLFPGIPSQTIAQNLLRELCEQGKLPEPASEYTIWFIDAQDQWKMVSIDGTVSPADPSQDPKKRIAVFDDVHTRGAERPSTAGVTEFVTLDIDTTWSRFEQGVMRERGLTRLTDTSKNKAPPGTGTYQARVRYILSPALKKQLDSSNTPLQLSNILHHLFSEEAKALQSVNLQAEVQKIEHILKSEVDAARLYMTRISKEKNETHHRRVREAIYSQTRHLFVKSTTVTPEQAGAPAVPVPTDAYLNSLVEKELKNLRALLSMSFLEDPTDEEELLLNAFKTRLKDAEAKLVAKFSEEVQKSISIDCSSFKSRIHPNYLPEKISASQIGLGQDQSTEVEQEQETQQEQEVAQEVASEKQKAPSNALFEYIPITLPTPDELSSLTTHPLLHKRVDLGLLPQQYGFYTENFCPTIRTHGKQTPGSHNIPLLNKTLLIIDAQNRVFEIHGSRIDVDRVFIPYVNQYQNGTELQSGRPLIWVHDYSTGAPPASITEKLSPDQARAVMRSICATKLANLDITLDTASKDRDPNDPTTIFENSFEAMVSYLKTLTPINGEQEQKKGPKLLEALENEIREKIALERPSIVYENSPLAHAFKQAKESMTQPGL